MQVQPVSQDRHKEGMLKLTVLEYQDRLVEAVGAIRNRGVEVKAREVVMVVLQIEEVTGTTRMHRGTLIKTAQMRNSI